MKIELGKKDKLLIVIIVLAAVGALFLHGILGKAGGGLATVKVNGVIEGVYDMREDQKIIINQGSNILEIKNGKADMVEADCPDKICVRQKPVSANHESIICLPNKVVVEITSYKEGKLDAVTN